MKTLINSVKSMLMYFGIFFFAIATLNTLNMNLEGTFDYPRKTLVNAFMSDTEKAHIVAIENELVSVKLQLVKIEEEKQLLQTKIENALIPEATVKEAFKVHVVEPIKQTTSNTINSVKNFFSSVSIDVLNKTEEMKNKFYEKVA